MKVKISDLDFEKLKQVKSKNILSAKSYYKTAPFATKTYLALQLKMPISFIIDNWAEITA